MLRIKKFCCNAFEELSYLVWAGKACVIIDPGFDSDAEFDALHKALKENGITPSGILLTHAHPDHVYGTHRLCEEFDIPVYANSGEEVTLGALHALCFNVGHSDVDDFSSRIVRVEDGQNLFFGNDGGLEFKVLFTPGHTAGGVCYLCREFRKDETSEENWKVLFCGDTLFAGCIGRSDLPGGDYTALMQGILTKLLCLDGDIDVLPGHGPSTTISDERMKNPFLQPFNEPYEE